MDKNKCPKKYFKNTLTEKKFCLGILFLSSQFKPSIYLFIMIFFLKNNGQFYL